MNNEKGIPQNLERGIPFFRYQSDILTCNGAGIEQTVTNTLHSAGYKAIQERLQKGVMALKSLREEMEQQQR